jgi:aminocarboxymuconate-semialdehyde decarboxylase
VKIDCFTHVMPQPYIDRFKQAVSGFYLGDLPGLIPEMVDIRPRLEMMDRHGIDRQVLTIATPPIEEVVTDPRLAAELATVANDAIAEMAARQPDRFLAVGRTGHHPARHEGHPDLLQLPGPGHRRARVHAVL